MSDKLNSDELIPEDYSDVEDQSLLDSEVRLRRDAKRAILMTPYVVSLIYNIILTTTLIILWWMSYNRSLKDPALGIWSPASGAVEYIENEFRGALFNQTEYMGFPDDETDKRWEELYNEFGISIISEEESKNLITPTLPIPSTKNYLVQLDVFHELHCLNDLRKMLYPERFDGLHNITVNGVIDRNDNMFRHWDHCIDALRQTLMCHADISPISFHINRPKDTGIFPRLATTHTCRNFDRIRQWAKDHSAGEFKFLLTPEEAAETIATAGFDQSPLEDIEFLWPSFPGNTFFKHWRDRPLIP